MITLGEVLLCLAGGIYLALVLYIRDYRKQAREAAENTKRGQALLEELGLIQSTNGKREQGDSGRKPGGRS